MAIRKIREFGLHPILAFLFFLIFGIIIHYTFILKNSESDWIVFLLPILFLLTISNPKKLEFLKLQVESRTFYILRILENLCWSIIPIFYLLLLQSYSKAVVLLVITILSAFITFRFRTHRTIPTPFRRYLYEFGIGFRKTFWMYPLSVFILFLSFYKENHFIGLFAWLLVMMTTLGYYSYPDEEFHIWNYASNSQKFLLTKIYQSIYYTTLISLPYILIFILFTKIEFSIIFIFLLVVYVLQSTIILSRYASYPQTILIPYTILIIMSLLFPPFLLFFIPYLFIKAKKKLYPILK